MKVDIPDKLYFKIGEVSKLAGVAPHVLRFWESEFKEINPKRANSKQRLYQRKDVETVLLIKELLHERQFTISGAKKYLAAPKNPALPPTDSAGKTEHLGQIKKELKQIKAVLDKRK